MSKQSVEQILKDVIESSNSKTVALTEQLQKLAGDNSSYTERMKKMEENLTSAMQKVLEMDSNIKEFHKAFGSKVEDIENKFASWWKNNEEDMDKPENWEEMTEDQQQEWIDEYAKTQVAKVAKKAEGNVIDGVNPAVVTGQPLPEKDKKKTEIQDEMQAPEGEDTYKAKKGKKAGKLKIEHEGPVEIENESEEGEEGEKEEETETKITAKKGKKALEHNVVKPDTSEITAEPVDEEAAKQTDKLEKSVAKAKAEDFKDGDTISVPPVNKKYDEELQKAATTSETAPQAVEEKAVIQAAEATPTPIADVAKIVESVSGKIEAAYEKLATATMKQAQAETKATEGEAEIAALKASAEQQLLEKHAALEAAKTLALEVKARDEASVAVKTLEARLAEMVEKIAQMEATDKSAEMKAAKMVASTGISEPVENAPSVSKEETDADVMKRFESLQGKEQRAFYIANRVVIERVAMAGFKNKFR